MNHDVFISYSSRNKATALAICHVLEEHRIRCWMAPRDIPVGADYGDVIDEAIVACRLFVLVFSEPASLSQWVKGELNLAFTEKKIILPYRIDAAPLKGAMRLILNQMHWVEAYPDAEAKFGELVESAARFLGRPAESAAPAASAASAASVPSAASARTDAAAPVVAAAGVSSAESVGSEIPVGSIEPSAAPVSEVHAAARRYAVGDYYDVGGKRGIVFEVDASGQHGKIVGLNQSPELRWCTKEEYAERRDIATGATDRRDGRCNQRTIERITGWREKYPAFAWCAAQGEGWYLPSIGELETLLLNDAVHEAVDRTLLRNNGAKLCGAKEHGDYWSSSESMDPPMFRSQKSAWFAKRVSMYYMSARGAGEKTCNCFVRAVAAF